MSDIGMPITCVSPDVHGDPKTNTTWYLCTEEGRPVCVGELVSTTRGYPCTIVGGRPPHSINSSGRVYVRFNDAVCDAEYFPSVVRLKWYDDTTMSEQTERGYAQDR